MEPSHLRPTEESQNQGDDVHMTSFGVFPKAENDLRATVKWRHMKIMCSREYRVAGYPKWQ